jgi:hypothetical protein
MFLFGPDDLRMSEFLGDDDWEFRAAKLATFEICGREMFALTMGNISSARASPPTCTWGVVVRNEVKVVGRFGTNFESELVPV